MHLQRQPPRGVSRNRCSEICSKFIGEHPCRRTISIKLLCNFIEITLRHGYSPVNLLHIFITPFPRNTSGWLLLHLLCGYWEWIKSQTLQMSLHECYSVCNLITFKGIQKRIFKWIFYPHPINKLLKERWILLQVLFTASLNNLYLLEVHKSYFK